MTTDLERRLRDALHDDAQRARLINPDRPPISDVVLPSDVPHRARSGRRLALVAASVALVAAAGVVLVQNARDRAPEVPTSPGPTQPPDFTVPPPAEPADGLSGRTPPEVTPPPGPPHLFTDIPPDSTVRLPPSPFDAVKIPAAVWTGTEIIVWGGIEDSNASVGDGAAFDLVTGTWRVIARAPITGRSHFQVAWTGTEMIVTGGLHRDGTLNDDGSYNQTVLTDGAAYNPATDTWRPLPDAPIATADSDAVWTGNEFVVVGVGNMAAAYDPVTNEWRRLADVPVLSSGLTTWGGPVWTGQTILTTVDSVLARYEPGTDTWHLDHEARYAALVGVPDADGVTRTVIGFPFDIGAPVDLLDDTGHPVGRLPSPPVDVDVFDRVEADGTWVGDEAVFWITNPDWGAGLGAPASYDHRLWALNSETGAWRKLPTDIDFPAVALGDILLASTDSQDGDATHPVLYRAPTTPTGDAAATHVVPEPEAVEEPATASEDAVIDYLAGGIRSGFT